MRSMRIKTTVLNLLFTKIAFTYLLIFLAWSCSNENPLIQPQPVIEGTWSEDFYWSSFGQVTIGGGTIEDSAMIKTSTLTFSENSFELKILPPHRIISSIGDSVFVTNNSDTVYTGSYRISEDTLKFIMGDEQITKRFQIKITGDSLRIYQLPNSVDTSGIAIYDISCFLWGNTLSKHSGVFVRKR